MRLAPLVLPALLALAACRAETPPADPAPAPTDARPQSETLPPTAPAPAPGAPADPAAWTLRADGAGPLRVGMTSAEVGAAVGHRVVPDVDDFGPQCAYAIAPTPSGDSLALMFSEDRLVRVEPHGRLVGETYVLADVRTPGGLGVGSTEAQVRGAFPALRVEPHAYDPNGAYLVAHPLPDTTLQLVFETDSTGTVTIFRGGRIPFVGYVEGCA